VSDPVRYFLDENFPRPVTDGLRSRGIDFVTAQELGLRQTPDVELLARAAQDRRVMVTEDPDFLELHNQGQAHWGIAFAPKGRSFGQRLRSLLLIWEVFTAEEMRGQVEYL